MSDHEQQTKLKRRSSKAVVEKKKLQRRVKYNAIGVARQQAIVASANVIHVDEEEVDLSDAFQFMDWYLSNVERIANGGGPIPESIVIEYKTNLLSLNLDGINRREKIQFVMDIVRAPELKTVCRELLVEDQVDDVVEALVEVPLIDFSMESGEEKIDGTTEEVTPEVSVDICEHKEFDALRVTPTDDILQFVNVSMKEERCPVLMLDEAYDFAQKEDNVDTCHYVVHWKLRDFQRLFIDDNALDEYHYGLSSVHVPLNVKVSSPSLVTQHYLSIIYLRDGIPGTLNVVVRNHEYFGLLGVSSGIGVITAGENGCCFLRV